MLIAMIANIVCKCKNAFHHTLDHTLLVLSNAPVTLKYEKLLQHLRVKPNVIKMNHKSRSLYLEPIQIFVTA